MKINQILMNFDSGTTSSSNEKNPKKLSQKELHSWRKQLTSTIEKLQKEAEKKDAKIAEYAECL